MDKKAISDALREAMNKENLHTRQVASYLNLNPCYISMSLNSNSWDAMGKAAWERINAWYESRTPLSQFNIPKSEEIWKPKEYEAGCFLPESQSVLHKYES